MMRASATLSLYSLLSAATTVAQVPSLHFQLAPVRLLVVVILASAALALVVLAVLSGEAIRDVQPAAAAVGAPQHLTAAAQVPSPHTSSLRL